MDEKNFLRQLNDQQKEAVLHRGPPLLILAGAGSGKTRVITTKIAYLIEYCGIDPRSILAVTFTNKAAREMADRVASFSSRGRDVMIRTFHSFGAWLLRRNAALAGLSSSFTIYDDEDSLTLLHSVCSDYKRQDLKPYMRWISRAKDYALGPRDDLSEISVDPNFPPMFQKYQQKARSIGNVDFGDLITMPIELLHSHEELKRRIHQRFRVILVDEYQDSNVAQYRLLRALYAEGCELCVVGDDDQSIYRFRGAEVQNILSFQEQFTGTRVIRLEENYRSTGNILRAASEVVSKNQGRLGKTLWTRNEDGAKPRLAVLSDHVQEAEFCADIVKAGPYRDYAVLYRTNAQSLAFETCFLKHSIPYRIVGALKFYDREEIKDVLSLLAFMLNPRDEVAFRRMINKPRRGIGEGGLDTILGYLPQAGGDLLAAASLAAGSLSTRAARGVKEFTGVLARAEAALDEEPLPQVILRLATDSGLIRHYAEQDEIASTQRVANIEELVNAAEKYPLGKDGLAAFLEDIELDRSKMTEALDGGDVVTLITMHNTKGLEFNRVIITGLEQDLFPGYRALHNAEDLEEERRIFYVSITRARKELYLTSCRQRLIWGRRQDMIPSVFLSELPQDAVEILDGHDAGPPPGTQQDYPPGTGVYHDDYGPGQVVKTWNNGKYDVVLVCFQNGRTAQFIPQYTPLEKVSLDY
ncbi:MAG: UvrD-helicase domain-containing protein [Spirochaetales bacterium]|nr:UvrD-helicase domain-containing protein [Spirochaetales bacterium]